jgi:hypothetical protein
MTTTVRDTQFPASNEDSWARIVQFIEKKPDHGWWLDYQEFLHPVIYAAIADGLHHFFRAGSSVSDIIFSTADRRLEALDPPPPRVTLRVNGKEKFIAWSHSNTWFSEPERMEFVTPGNALSVLKVYLKDLWMETRPSESLPECLEPDQE